MNEAKIFSSSHNYIYVEQDAARSFVSFVCTSLFDAQFFFVRKSKNALDGIQMSLGVFLIGQEVVDGALEKL